MRWQQTAVSFLSRSRPTTIMDDLESNSFIEVLSPYRHHGDHQQDQQDQQDQLESQQGWLFGSSQLSSGSDISAWQSLEQVLDPAVTVRRTGNAVNRKSWVPQLGLDPIPPWPMRRARSITKHPLSSDIAFNSSSRPRVQFRYISESSYVSQKPSLDKPQSTVILDPVHDVTNSGNVIDWQASDPGAWSVPSTAGKSHQENRETRKTPNVAKREKIITGHDKLPKHVRKLLPQKPLPEAPRILTNTMVQAAANAPFSRPRSMHDISRDERYKRSWTRDGPPPLKKIWEPLPDDHHPTPSANMPHDTIIAENSQIMQQSFLKKSIDLPKNTPRSHELAVNGEASKFVTWDHRHTRIAKNDNKNTRRQVNQRRMRKRREKPTIWMKANSSRLDHALAKLNHSESIGRKRGNIQDTWYHTRPTPLELPDELLANASIQCDIDGAPRSYGMSNLSYLSSLQQGTPLPENKYPWKSDSSKLKRQKHASGQIISSQSMLHPLDSIIWGETDKRPFKVGIVSRASSRRPLTTENKVRIGRETNDTESSIYMDMYRQRENDSRAVAAALKAAGRVKQRKKMLRRQKLMQLMGGRT